MAAEADYFNINRRLLKSDLWLSEPFTRGQAWVDLVGLANWRGGFVRVRGVQLELNRGQLAGSDAWLSERWRWSRGKVRRFLSELEGEHRIVQQKNNVCTLLTIVNYETYQGRSTADGTPNGQQNRKKRDTKRTADGQQTEQQKCLEKGNESAVFREVDVKTNSECPESGTAEWQKTDTQEEGNTKKQRSKEVKCAADAPSLVDWLNWWNLLHREQLVPCGVEVDPPSEAARRGWKRLGKDQALQNLLANRDAIEREIRTSAFCREPWFRFEKLFARNRDGEYIVRKLLDRGYRGGGIQRSLSGSIHDENAATDPDHGKW